jgi:transglutaminase-like putative cysteine protease
MHLKIEHTTTFTYDHPISEAYTEMRLKPLDADGQRCLAFALTTQPRDEVLQYTDRFANDVRHFDVLQPHTQLQVIATSEVYTAEAFPTSPEPLSLLDECDYLMATHYAPFTPELSALGIAPQNAENPFAAVWDIMQAVHNALTYTKGATDVTTTAAQALALGQGVCQDYTHIMLAACRSRGLPARYVSGYLYTTGHAAASHAWVDVYLPQTGWVSLDPTHNRAQTGQYVRVAVGRDYADVPPTRGVFKGKAKETMEVAVFVTAL